MAATEGHVSVTNQDCPLGGGNPSLQTRTPGTRQSRVAEGHPAGTPKAPLTDGNGVTQ